MKIHNLLKETDVSVTWDFISFLLFGISHPSCYWCSCYLGFHILPVIWDFTSFVLLVLLLLGISYPSCYLGFHILHVTDVPVTWDFTSFLLIKQQLMFLLFLLLGISYPCCYWCSCYLGFHILPVTERWAGAHMCFFECIDTVLNWTELMMMMVFVDL